MGQKIIGDDIVVNEGDSCSVPSSGCLGGSVSKSIPSQSADASKSREPDAQQEGANAERTRDVTHEQQTPTSGCGTEGKCTPCIYVAKGILCISGDQCQFCHEPDCGNRNKVKPGKHKRQRMKKLAFNVEVTNEMNEINEIKLDTMNERRSLISL